MNKKKLISIKTITENEAKYINIDKIIKFTNSNTALDNFIKDIE